MQGKHHFQAKSLVYIDMDKLIPAHHLLRKIDQHVDFSFIRALTKNYYCPHNGRPSIDPEVFFRLMVISYLYGVSSDRQLCEAVRYNLAYRWFCKLSLEDEVPEHSSLTRIRDRLGLETFKSFFEEILRQCKSKGLLKGERIMTDSTLIEANASLDSLVKRDQKEGSSAAEAPVKKTSTVFSFTPEKISNKTHYSFSDPDATLAFKKGKAQGLKYKAHVSIDTDSRIILSIPMTIGACHESQVYLDEIKTIKENPLLNIHEAIADRGYGGGEIIQGVIDQGIIPYIPLFTEKTGKMNENHAEGFVFEEKYNRYRCPKEIYLLPYSKISKDRRVMYRSKAKDCRHCEIASSCPAEKMHHSQMRFLRRNIHQGLFEKTIERMKTSIFINRLVERFWKIEGFISEAKNRHNLGRAKYRGLVKTQIQAYLSACAVNIKRIIQSFLLFLSYLLWQKKLVCIK